MRARPNYTADRKSTRLNSSHLGISYAVFCLNLRSDRKSTRLNSSHLGTPYAVFCLKKKTLTIRIDQRISVKTSRSGDTCTGEIVEPVLASDNGVLLPKGIFVAGGAAASFRLLPFKGTSLL